MERVIYIIPTPIGNLEDITLRAIRILKESDLILVEDSRVTRKLLNNYNITTKMISYHAFNEHKKTDEIIDKIDAGFKISLVSDAGTPSISDPGFLLIRACIKHNITIACLPGPTACITALVKSGLPCDKFHFEGFLPVKKKRAKLLNIISNYENTTIIYESPHRILKTLNDLNQFCGERNVVVIKEISKVYETAYRGNIREVIDSISNSKLKGEFVIILDGKK
ncbi:MAG: 16S rRNA (cytidine(1402)-2'-O)-methyltransferase [Flavobacteriales bacterium]|jgi:16S rRNA (cytidine1402-2'-O)-methyltransferase|nr:16S rRNA (cytidine(1402)-2'-O)-methyltransferase [Flavobacteriales bacterium]